MEKREKGEKKEKGNGRRKGGMLPVIIIIGYLSS